MSTDTQRIITDEMGTVISIICGRAYTVSVMVVVDESQRSEPDRESITAGGYRKDMYERISDSDMLSNIARRL